MKKASFIGLFLLFYGSFLFARSIIPYERLEFSPPSTDNGEILIDFENDESFAKISTFFDTFGVQASWFSREEKWVSVRNLSQELLFRLKKEIDVEIIEPNYYLSAMYVPNDPYYKHQWHLDLVGMQKAWDFPKGAPVVVAVIDTGIAYENFENKFRVEDLGESQFVDPYNFINNTRHANDDHGHGTHVAGTIAQLTNNGIGVAGVSPQVKLMPLKVLNASGYGTISDIAEAIRYAADHGAKVINLSLGGPFPSRILHKAIRYARDEGVVVVAAAGNSGGPRISYPANYKECISVSAVRYDRQLTWYSSYGKGLTIAAPGGDLNVDQNKDGLLDGVLQNTLHPQDPTRQGYFLFQGTSMATPHVAAAAALLISHGITDPDKVKKYLQETATRVKDGTEEKYGAGVLNVEAALQAAYSHRRWKTFLLGVIILVLLLRFLNKGKSRTEKIPWNIATLVGLMLGSTGFFVLDWIPFADGSFLLTHSPQEWGLAISFCPNFATSFFATVLLPAMVVFLLFPWKKAATFSSGFALGASAFFLYQSLSPALDVSWLPYRFLIPFWYAVNSLLCLFLGAVATFRFR